MSKKKKKNTRIPHKFLPWIDVRKKYRLSHAQVQMARELGMSPKRFDRLANTEHKPWKVPLPQFIESLYEKKFGKTEPDHVQSIEDMAAEHMARREERKAAKAAEEAAAEVAEEAAAEGTAESSEDGTAEDAREPSGLRSDARGEADVATNDSVDTNAELDSDAKEASEPS
ncbi:hypothetical protein [Novipirellula rosea]|uniref:HTH cro/C1-type domain-containing protein n=1 Tax=Novipirellula rosea TaxID=1031540 RepID=A0ABP8ML52_9BACT